MLQRKKGGKERVESSIGAGENGVNEIGLSEKGISGKKTPKRTEKLLYHTRKHNMKKKY